jgi:hypothetical protein
MQSKSVKIAPVNDTDFMRLDMLENAHFYGCKPGDVLVLFYAERCDLEGMKGFNSVCSEYFAVSDMVGAEAAFEKRLKADNPCKPAVGQTVEKVLGRAA